jgi:hypothetical protein
MRESTAVRIAEALERIATLAAQLLAYTAARTQQQIERAYQAGHDAATGRDR